MSLQSSVDSESAKDDITKTTSDAIARSRNFLETKLLPDFRLATARLQHLEEKRDKYIRLQEAIQSMESSKNNTKEGVDKKNNNKASGITTLANLGQGVHLPVEIQSEALLIVSLGLEAKDGSEGSSSDAGLYLQLTSNEAKIFSKRKIDILTR
jgi:hypothetical protein